MAWLARLFRKKVDEDTKPSTSERRTPFDTMSLEEILLAHSSPSDLSVRDASGLYTRLQTIAHAQAATPEQRATALRAAQTLAAAVYDGLSHTPDAQAAMRANFETAELAAKWDSAPSGNPMDVLVALENAHLISTFAASQGADRWLSIRPSLIRHLLISRRRTTSDNPVFVCYWLLHTRDQTAWHVLTSEERQLLLRADTGYCDARGVLVRLGLLPGDSLALPYLPLPDRVTLRVFLLASVSDENSPVAVTSDIIERDATRYGEGFTYGFQLLRTAFRQALALRLTGGIYGPAFAEDLRGEFKAVFVNTGAVMAPIWGAVDEAFAISERETSLGVAQAFLAPRNPEMMSGADQATHEGAFQLATKWLEDELYGYPTYWRFLIRHSIHGEEASPLQRVLEDNILLGE